VRIVLDRVLALLLCVCLSLLVAAIAVAIRLDSRGPILFRQARGGLKAKPFTILKFRTMSVDSPVYGRKPSDDDPRITPLGAVLRRTGLDELPQLLNVIRGEMSLIGPRPEQYLLLSRFEPWMHERHLIRPGLTGWWQVHHRTGTPIYEDVEKDIYYVRNQGPWLDLQILVRTVHVLISGLRGHGRGRGLTGIESDTA
jgi:lipopolysaccharide/colanic/teichoic acid biosynthesis glycosyltransferase